MAGLVVSGLVNYVNQESLEQLVRETMGTKTAKMCNPVPGVKSSFDLHLIASSPANQVGGDCAFNASGTTGTFTKRNLVTSPVKVEDNICLQTLETKYTQRLLTAGQDYSGADVPKVVMDSLLAEIAEDMEQNDWTGTVAGTAKYDGIHTILAAETLVNANSASYIPGGSIISSVDETNIYKVVQGLYRAMLATAPGVIAKNPVIVLPLTWFGYLQQYYLDKNYFAYNGTGTFDPDGTIPLLGFANVKVMGTIGLEGLSTAYMLDFKKNVFLGYDADAAAEGGIPKIWYSQDNLTHKYSIRYRRGFQVAYPTEVIKFTIPGS